MRREILDDRAGQVVIIELPGDLPASARGESSHSVIPLESCAMGFPRDRTIVRRGGKAGAPTVVPDRAFDVEGTAKVGGGLTSATSAGPRNGNAERHGTPMKMRGIV